MQDDALETRRNRMTSLARKEERGRNVPIILEGATLAARRGERPAKWRKRKGVGGCEKAVEGATVVSEGGKTPSMARKGGDSSSCKEGRSVFPGVELRTKKGKGW